MNKKLYKVTTAYDGSGNWDSYNVIAENGLVAMVKVNTMVFKTGRKKQEVADEVEFIGSVDIEV